MSTEIDDLIDQEIEYLDRWKLGDGTRWLWEYRVQVEDAFHERVSFFLLAESMLFAGFAVLVASSNGTVLFPMTFALFGIVLSLLWWNVTARQRASYLDIRRHLSRNSTLYRLVRKARPEAEFPQFHAAAVLGKIPVLTLTVWFVLLVCLVYRGFTVPVLRWLWLLAK